MIIHPDPDLITQAEALVLVHAQTLADIYGVSRPEIFVDFDKRGQVAGMARRRGNVYSISFNRTLLLREGQRFLQRTVPHEVAHIMCWHVWGRKIGHGKEWKRMMRELGVDDSRCHSYNIDHTRPFIYRCECREHPLTSIRHGKIRRGTTYRCSRCKTPLEFSHERT